MLGLELRYEYRFRSFLRLSLVRRSLSASASGTAWRGASDLCATHYPKFRKQETVKSARLQALLPSTPTLLNLPLAAQPIETRKSCKARSVPQPTSKHKTSRPSSEKSKLKNSPKPETLHRPYILSETAETPASEGPPAPRR